MHVTYKNSLKLILPSKVPPHLITESKIIKNKNKYEESKRPKAIQKA